MTWNEYLSVDSGPPVVFYLEYCVMSWKKGEVGKEEQGPLNEVVK